MGANHHSQDQWQRFYAENGHYHTVDPVAPQIDFDAYTIVVGGLSWRGSHKKIVVEDSVDNGDDKNIQVAIVTPGSRCALAMLIDYPNIAILIPKPAGTINIHTRVAVVDCP